jgi:hypothetical protein
MARVIRPASFFDNAKAFHLDVTNNHSEHFAYLAIIRSSRPANAQ